MYNRYQISPGPLVVNDVTGLNPIAVGRVETPRSVEEIQALVRAYDGPVSIGGGRFSMGGQTATEGCLFLDLRTFNQVLAFFPTRKEITVQTGITWREIQRSIDPHDLALQIMQSYCNFSVGGSLSVNSHGRYMGLGPLIMSVASIRIVLASGDVVTATPDENSDLFYGAIGGYGALGVIVEATLLLTENRRIERHSRMMPVAGYSRYFAAEVRNSSDAVFHNADIFRPYEMVRAVTYTHTDKPPTIHDRRVADERSYWLNQVIIHLITDRPWGGIYRKLLDRRNHAGPRIVWRNYEASYDVRELEPTGRETSTYVLQEYFVPVGRFDEFMPRMAEILTRYRVNALNVSVRHAKADPGSLLAWAADEVFAFVLYYKQGVTPHARAEVAVWTRELIEAALACGGRWYLPYQIVGTREQFHRGYARADEFFALKQKYDPKYKFRNKLWDAYYSPVSRSESTVDSTFKTVFEDVALRDGFYRFLQNVYHLYPEGLLHHRIHQATMTHSTDEQIYRSLQRGLAEIAPTLGAVRYALPSLIKQRKEMVDETAQLLGTRRRIDGYAEIGTVGRYVTALRKRLRITGPTYLVGDTDPGFGLNDVFERGRIPRTGTYVANHYEPISAEAIPDESVDLATVYIGLHHSPLDRLDAFVRSIHRILRPGGRLVVRDHDAHNRGMQAMVALAHDVYNCGIGVTWEENAAEIRHFTSVPQLENYLAERGFQSSGKRVLQAHDPTLNTLLEFVRLPAREEREHERDNALTWLGLPEWYIVYSAREYAQFAATEAPSGFPWFGSIAQYWRYYWKVCRWTRGVQPFPFASHLMLWIIGLSFTAENLFKGLYESTVGRLTERLGIGDRCPEEAAAARAALEYARFLDLTPWFDFPFYRKLGQILAPPSGRGGHWLRRLERRFFVTLEYLAKTFYAWVVRTGTRASYEPEVMTTAVRVAPIDDASSDMQLLITHDDGSQTWLLPRYGPFTPLAQRLARAGVRFHDIAGNSEILLTALGPRVPVLAGATLLDRTPVLTAPGTFRFALRVEVAALSATLVALEDAGCQIERVYDF